jgi:hypothetical protein
MRKFFNGLVIGLFFGAVGFWFVQSKARQHPGAEQRFETSAALMHASASNAFGYFSDAFSAKLEALDLLPRQIKQELAQSGMIVRRTAHDLGEKVATAATDARVVAALKAEYAADQNLSSWRIAVSCTQGHVALSGMVSSPDDIGRAIVLALETDGVRDVTCTIQVKTNGLAGTGS